MSNLLKFQSKKTPTSELLSFPEILLFLRREGLTINEFTEVEILSDFDLPSNIVHYGIHAMELFKGPNGLMPGEEVKARIFSIDYNTRRVKGYSLDTVTQELVEYVSNTSSRECA